MPDMPPNIPPGATPKKRGLLRTVVLWVVVGVVLLVALWSVLVNFVARTYLIPSESMAPTLNVGNRIVVDKLAYRSNSPQPGDVIVIKSPPAWSVGYKSIRSHNTAVRWLQDGLSVAGLIPPDENDIVKRVIAVGGQTVECRASTGLTVDGTPLAEPYLNPATMMADPAVYPCLGNEFGPVTVTAGRLWVMGDNRTHSADSRAHCTSTPAEMQRGLLCTGDPTAGTIPVDDVIGKMRFVTNR
jgi:signal peptidase I